MDSPGIGSGHRRYMSKAQRACDGCRTRKSACQIDVAPPCRLCRAHGQPCEFTSRVRRRKSPLTGSPKDALDYSAAASQSFNHLPHPDIAQPQAQHPLLELPGHISSGQSPLTGLDVGPALNPSFPNDHEGQPDQTMFDDLVLSMYDTYQPPVLSPNPAGIPRSLDNLPDFTAQLCGLTGDMDPYVLQHYKYDPNSEFTFSKLTIRQVQQAAVPVQFLLSKQELNTDARAESELCPSSDTADVNAIVPREVGERLIKLFFRFIQPQFPILSQDAPPSPMTTPTHLLAAIYCIAQPFATFDDYLCIELVYTPPSAQSLLNMAWRILNQSLSQPTISSIQTALILLLRLPTNPLVLDSAWKWTLLGMTVSMAQTLGLHLDPNPWNLPESEALLRRRLSWLIYTFDKWLAFSFGRPSHISKADWLVIEFSEPDVYPGAGSVPTFPLEFSKLTTILDLTLRNLYSTRSSATLSRDFRLTFESARPLLDELAQWAQNAPSTRPQDPLVAYDGFAPLHIAYHSVKILIIRALLRPFNQTDYQVPVEDKAEWAAAELHIRQAARLEIDAALSRISSLEAVDYQGFWAPWYKTCFALITHLIFLLAVSSYIHASRSSSHDSAFEEPEPETPEKNADYIAFRNLLDQARAVFRLHSRSLDIFKFALLRIDAVFWMGWEKVLGFG